MDWKRQLWAEWEIVEEIGSGSYGTVYKIRRYDIGGTYFAALKVITIPRNEDEVRSLCNAGMDHTQIVGYYHAFAVQLAREFAAMERLKGISNIVSYEDHKIVPRQEGYGYHVLIRMELLMPLGHVMSPTGCGEEMAVRIGKDISSALMYCEREGIMHRDVKPGNIFVTDHGDFKLGDFSVATVSGGNRQERTPMGTYAYMAPEVYFGQHYDHSADIYSLGLILYRFLNDGRAPFMPLVVRPLSSDEIEQANKLRLSGTVLPKPIRASERMAQIIRKACAYHPYERYRSAKELFEDLNVHASMETIQPGSYSSAALGPKESALFASAREDVLRCHDDTNFSDTSSEETKKMNRFFFSAGDL